MAVRSLKCEIVAFDGDRKEITERWMKLSRDVTDATNYTYLLWQQWHFANGTHQRMQDHQAAYRKWVREGSVGEKPKLKIEYWPSDMAAWLSRHVSSRYPHIHARVLALMLQMIRGKLAGKSAHVPGRKVWEAIILCKSALPTCNHLQAVPFDRQNAATPTPISGNQNYAMWVRIFAYPRGSKTKISDCDSFQLKVRGGCRAVVARIASGQWEFKGSRIRFDDRSNKWFAEICYERPSKLRGGLDKDRVAVLWPGRRDPWILKIGEWFSYPARSDRPVAVARHRLLTGRWSRSEHYRVAGSSQKGHGRKRALAPIERLSHHWKQFVKTHNHTTTKTVVDTLTREYVGKLVVLLPRDEKRVTRCLAVAGKVEGRHDATGWDWTQFEAFLKYKCEDEGIELEVRTYDTIARKKQEKKAVQLVRNNAKPSHSSKA